MPSSGRLGTRALFLLAGGLAACGNDSELVRLTHEDVFYQEGTDEADILFVVDNSVSMEQEQELLAQGFDRFVLGLGETEVDFHIAVTTTDMDRTNEERGRFVGEPPFLTPEDAYIPLFMQRVHVGTEGSDKERGLQAALFALTDPSVQDTNGGFLRDEAVLALVFVSDENDCSDDNYLPDSADGSLCYEDEGLVPVADYIRSYQGIKGPGGRVVASAIVGPKAAEGCETSWPGLRYMTVAEELGGVIGSICESDYGDLLDAIGSRISEPSRIFYLSYAAVEESLVVEVNDVELEPDPATSWTYDAEYAAIRFDGSYVPDFGSVIRVTYEVAGEG